MRSNRSSTLASLPGLGFAIGAILGGAEATLYLVRYPGLRPMGPLQILTSSAAVGLLLLVGTLVSLLLARILAARNPQRETTWQLGAALALSIAGAAGVMTLASFRSTIVFRHLPGGDLSRLLSQLLIVALSLFAAYWLTPRLGRALRGRGLLARSAHHGRLLIGLALAWILVAVLGVAGLGRTRPTGHVATADRPNVILISIDTLRADHLSSYGYSRDTTPHIDELARGGVRFTNATTTWPSSAPGHASMLTGLYPPTHGVMGNGYRMSSVVPTLSEAARAQGLNTAGFINNPWLSYTLGFAQGFDTYFDAERLEVASEAWPELLLQNVSLYRLILGLGPGERQPATGLARRWVERHCDERFFLFLHLLDPHQPYTPDPAFHDRFLAATGAQNPGDTRVFMGRARKQGAGGMGRNTGDEAPMTAEQATAVTARYDECVANADARIGELLGALETLGLRDRTLIVLTSDHGENMNDNQPRFHHEGLFEATMHVPFVMSGPGVEALRPHANAPVSLVDIFPTLADMADLTPPPVLSGISLASTEADPQRPILAVEGVSGPAQTRSLRSGDWKLIHSADRGRSLVRISAGDRYNRADVNEVETFPALAESLEAELERLFLVTEENAYPSEEGTEELDQERIDQLKALGYL